MSDSPTGRDRLAQIHDIIRERITMLDYPPGERLSETALAEEFGTSRTPLRRVLARLEDEGLLRSVHGVGTIVTDVDLDELDQVYRLRKELIILVGQLDPEPVTADMLAAFEALHHRAVTLADDPSPRGFAALDRDMFLALMELSGNRPLRAISEQLYFRTARIWLQAVTADRIDLKSEVDIYVRETAEIFEALSAGDLDAVCHLRRAHIALSIARMR
ncbi:GntR family transcriptional regulator [Martelella endophytica]|uniref:GntR family transcriptional regulator n=1 Tax=Martelella endophytica TaxID=1486262 RepID=A0A0D5LN58_MAREN|nr:GntR family transcriptional regulator [Martelella endophytica]AJY45659.1 GntR family transcriptional regulator [Martelella endophytica]